jgi:phosphatidylserine/phosphatidylglycerophosphate/cardiolipin synthase-like enzyme
MSAAMRVLLILLFSLPSAIGAGSVAAAAGSDPGATKSGSADAPALGNYSPQTGATFNDPTGGVWAKGRIINHIVKTINSSPPRSVIRMAVFSFAHPDVADALVAAYHRGVRIRLVFADENIYDPMRRLQRLLGSSPTNPSFAVICSDSCRGISGHMHAKYFSFRRAGTSEFVTMVGSVNLTRYNAEKQWNDIYTSVGDRAFYKAFGRWFGQLKNDSPVDPSYMVRSAPQTEVTFTPLDRTVVPDPIYGILSRVRCLVASEEIDPNTPTPGVMVPTQIMVSAHAWNGLRGRTLAQKVAELAGAGCVIRVIGGVGQGPLVNSILVNAGIPVSSGTHPGVHTHQKLLVIQGGFDALPRTTRVITGSSNWSDRALNRDDIVVHIDNEAVGAQYIANFDHMWFYG